MHLRPVKRALVVAGLLGLPLAAFAGDPEIGRQKAGNCIGCHGVTSYFNVYPTYRVPRLGGQHADYLVSALKAYKSGERQHATMQAQASSLSEEDIQNLASYFSTFGQ
jgi:cytochrome c553